MTPATPDPNTATTPPLRLAVVGAGPAGLALALLAAERLPQAQITLFDARPLARDISSDPRTLAFNLGSVQLLQRLGVWPSEQAQPILQVLVSQAPPTLSHPLFGASGQPEVCISAAEQGVAQLGAVLSYGQLVAPLQAAWLSRCAADPQRLISRFGTPVAALKPRAQGVEIDAGIAESFDLGVEAEGGVFADQMRKAQERRQAAPEGAWTAGLRGEPLVHDYQQNAWVGTVTLAPNSPPGVAYERFTRNGPLALLPLRSIDGQRRAALVWCMPQAEDAVAELNDAQRLALLNTLLPAHAGPLQAISPLKCFALGLNAEHSLVKGRIVKIGNAAQTLHPVAGQGLNLGLRDAFSLVQALAEQSPDLDTALRRIAWQRAPDRWAAIATTDFLARSFAWRWPGLPVARSLGLALVQAVPPLKRALAKQMMWGVALKRHGKDEGRI